MNMEKKDYTIDYIHCDYCGKKLKATLGVINSICPGCGKEMKGK